MRTDQIDPKQRMVQDEKVETNLHELWQRAKIAGSKIDAWEKTRRNQEKTIVNLELLKNMNSEQKFIFYLSKKIIENQTQQSKIKNLIGELNRTVF